MGIPVWDRLKGSPMKIVQASCMVALALYGSFLPVPDRAAFKPLPESGERLGALLTAGAGVSQPTSLRLVDLEVLPSIQGYAWRPFADDLAAEVEHGTFIITRPGGLRLSTATVEPPAGAVAPPTDVDSPVAPVSAAPAHRQDAASEPTLPTGAVPARPPSAAPAPSPASPPGSTPGSTQAAPSNGETPPGSGELSVTPERSPCWAAATVSRVASGDSGPADRIQKRSTL